jgi:hypothetical protein
MNVAIQYELQNQYKTHQRLSLNIRPNISHNDAKTAGRYEENDVGGISERSTFADFFAFFATFLAAFFSAFAAIFASFFGLTIVSSVRPLNLFYSLLAVSFGRGMSFKICRGTLGSLAMFTAIRNASLRDSRFVDIRRCGSSSK